MTSSITVKYNLLPQLSAALDAELAVAVENVATDAAQWMQAELHAAKSGRLYQRPYGVHQASAPGETPATDTGETEATITVQMLGQTSAEVSVAGHALELEFGSTKVAPRPMMPAAAAAMEPKAEVELAAAVARAVGGTP